MKVDEFGRFLEKTEDFPQKSPENPVFRRFFEKNAEFSKIFLKRIAFSLVFCYNYRNV